MQNVVERILNLLAFLLTADRPVTADEIRMTVAGYDQSSDAAWRRMFERDKDLLRELGVPLELRPTDGWEIEHGYVVPEDRYRLEDPGLTDEERTALWLASQVVRIGGGPSGPDALFKLGGTPLEVSGEPLAADLGQQQDVLGDVFAAIGERRHLRFDYRSKARRVAPYGLVHRRGHWYLVADDEGVAKAFRMDRIGRVEAGATPAAFERPADLDPGRLIPSAPWEAGGDDLTAVVEFDAEVAWWARRQLVGDHSVDELEDGRIRASVMVANPEAFLGWIIGFEDHAVIVSPPELRDRLLDRVEGVA